MEDMLDGIIPSWLYKSPVIGISIGSWSLFRPQANAERCSAWHDWEVYRTRQQEKGCLQLE